ncbi:MAG TPA: SGNH/GDSL hydrolase family protein, partial [Tepidisphaeraceae bacterium]
AASARAGDVAVAGGEKVAFLGDSITQNGAASGSGYVRQVASGLKANGINIEVIAAGIGGHKSPQMLERLGRDVISKQPTWVTISCGVNDVMHGDKGVDLATYRKHMTDIVDQCQAAGIKVMLLTATPIGEDLDGPMNKTLAAYNDFVRELAAEKKCLLADLNAAIAAELTRLRAGPHPKGHMLTTDGVHMNPLGNRVMAVGVLKAFGLDEAQMQKAQDVWLDEPKAVELKPTITLRQYEKLFAAAADQGAQLNATLNETVSTAIDSLPNGAATTQPTTQTMK